MRSEGSAFSFWPFWHYKKAVRMQHTVRENGLTAVLSQESGCRCDYAIRISSRLKRSASSRESLSAGISIHVCSFGSNSDVFGSSGMVGPFFLKSPYLAESPEKGYPI